MSESMLDAARRENAPLRRALIANAKPEDVERIARLLPGNYSIGLNVIVRGRPGVVIEGHDNAGWTLDEYVLPRLASGLFFGKEIKAEFIWKLSKPDGGPGCYVEGSWGIYGPGRVIEIANDLGFPVDPNEMAAVKAATYNQVPDQRLFDRIMELVDMAEAWLNEHAPEGFMWGWSDGEFFYQPESWWDES